MTIGRKEISVLLLATGALLFFGVFLLSVSSDAQTGGGSTGGGSTGAGSSNAGCPNPQRVQTFTGSDSQITPTFDIMGTTFQIALEADLVRAGEFGSIFVDSVDQQGFRIPFGGLDENPVEGSTSESANVLEGPGTFSLEVQSTNVNYEITVFDCIGSSQGQDPTTQNRVTPPPASSSSPANRNQQRNNIVPGSVPNRPLPPTGGLPVSLVVAGFVLTGAGMLGTRLLIRRAGRRG